MEVERIRADRDLWASEQSIPLTLEPEQRFQAWVCRVLGAFAHLACELCRRDQWTVKQVSAAVEEFRQNLIYEANSRSEGRLAWVDRVFSIYIRPDLLRRIENSEEWQCYQGELLAVAEAHVRAGRDTPEVDHGARDGVALAAGADRPVESAFGDSPDIRLSRFREKHCVTYTEVMRSARVHKAELQKWRAGKLKPESVMSQRIENVLSGKLPLKREPRKQRGN